MIIYEYITKEKIQNPHPYRILIVADSGSGKTNTLINLIKQQNDNDYNIIDKIYLYVKDPNEAKYQYLIKDTRKNWSCGARRSTGFD